MQVSLKGYHKPTPVKIKKVADAVLVATTALGPVFHTVPGVGIAVMTIGAVAKLLSNIFVDESNDQQ